MDDGGRTMLDGRACILGVMHGRGDNMHGVTMRRKRICQWQHARQERALRPDAEGRNHGDTER